jgi:ATP-dependent Clp protease protease subunit
MKISEEKQPKEEKKEEKGLDLLSAFYIDDVGGGKEENRSFGLYEDLSEEAGASMIYSLLHLHKTGKQSVLKEEAMDKEEPTDEDYEETYKPIKFIISTHGGSAHEMFSIYDVMDLVKEDCDIETIGLGKVMSAGVLLLAAGTKGKRKIGKNCRVMIHPVAGGAVGDLQDIENDTKEIKVLQKQYIECLARETNLSEKKLRSLIKKKVNCYFSAEEAIEMGIADQIL